MQRNGLTGTRATSTRGDAGIFVTEDLEDAYLFASRALENLADELAGRPKGEARLSDAEWDAIFEKIDDFLGQHSVVLLRFMIPSSCERDERHPSGRAITWLVLTGCHISPQNIEICQHPVRTGNDVSCNWVPLVDAF